MLASLLKGLLYKQNIMSKEELKTKISKRQKNRCALSDNLLPSELSLADSHRKNPKMNGGIYTEENTVVSDPIAHMIEHGNLRLRTKQMDDLKILIDDREQIMKLRNKVANQLLAFKRGTDIFSKDTLEFLNIQLKDIENKLAEISHLVEKQVKQLAQVDPLIKSALGVKSIGPITIAYCSVYIDLEKARHASCLWSYTGLHKPSHERYEKNIAGGGNKRLRTILYTMADSQIKGRGPYREVYDRTKERLAKSEKIVKSRNTQGKLIECMWKDAKPGHRHGAALRKIMKHFLADYWMVGRTLMGLPVSPLYPEAILGGNHRTIMPEERGWEY